MNITIETIYNTFKNKHFNLFVKSIRDLTLIQISDRHYIVIAVDSDGGIGPLEGDIIKVSPYIAGRFAIRVPLLEILASGATPVCAFDMLTLPMDANGKEILRGIKEELQAAGFGNDFVVSGSTEDNIKTNMTGIGTTIVGMILKEDLRPGTAKENDLLIAIGKPKSGPDDTVSLDDPEIISQRSMLTITELNGVHDILPVGSHGIEYEAKHIAASARLLLEMEKHPVIDIHKSAGPSTCVLAACTEEAYHILKERITTPVFRIGIFNDLGEK